MPCFKPLNAWMHKGAVVFSAPVGHGAVPPFNLPCGQCIGCRLHRSREWAIRCYHEAKMHDVSSFVTLTFSDEYLFSRKRPWSVEVRDVQLFLKRLRKLVGPVRYFSCGEYGDQTARPHYHLLLFGVGFPDRRLHSTGAHPLYNSDTLSQAWPYGHAVIGDVTFESAAYCARYCTKKITGDDAEEHYNIVHPVTGEVIERSPEFSTQSRKPGLARKFFEEYKSDIFPRDYVVVDGIKLGVPRYYDKQLPEDELEVIKRERCKRNNNPLYDGVNYDDNWKRLYERAEHAQYTFNKIDRQL